MTNSLLDTLEDLDINVWFDEANMTIGSLPGDEAKKAIEEVQYVLVLLSAQSLKSKWVIQEIEMALEIEAKINRVKVLPVLLDDCEVPNSLRDRVHGRLRSVDDLEKVAAMIKSRLQS